MNAASGVRRIAREVLAAALGHRVQAATMLAVVAAATLSLVLTSGRSAGLEAAVLATVDAKGTRSIHVQATGASTTLSHTIVDDLSRLEEVEEIVGFGPTQEGTAAAIPEGAKVGVRVAYGSLQGRVLRQPDPQPVGQIAWTSKYSAAALGLPPGAGSIRLVDGPELMIVDSVDVPEHLRTLEPLVLVPASVDTAPVLTSIDILVTSADALPMVNSIVGSYLEEYGADEVTVSTSRQWATLRDAIGGELAKEGRTVVGAVMGATALFALVVASGFAMANRRDLGRRRALGATRSLIVTLVVGQVFVTVSIGAGLGAALGAAWLAIEGSPQPPVAYLVAISVLVTAAASAATALPAVIAARRDPVRELRVP